jgi:hypothetical protein
MAIERSKVKELMEEMMSVYIRLKSNVCGLYNLSIE